MKITAIAAVGRNWELGRNNDLIWKMPEDMRHFKQTTEHHAVLMGRKTYESIGKPLPNRRNYILTRSSWSGGLFMGDVNQVSSIDVAINNASRSFVDHLFVIGGGELYRHVIEKALCHEIILTYIHDTAADADTFFPNMDSQSNYVNVDCKPLNHMADIRTYIRTDLL